ncbi:MAG: CvpA family protein [Methylobacteriaceae bacterium]|nr:CvpA family protein [Methylobacteriaceae bacterium]
MPAYLDLGLIAVVLVSALLSMVRGFTREVLAIASWGAAAVAAFYFYPTVAPHLAGYPYMDKESVRQGVAAALVFIGTLIVVSIITVKISDMILDSKVGALDRSLGFLFGAARGFLLCVVAFLFFGWLVQGKEPDWSKNARMRPFLQSAGDQLKALLPDDPESTFLKQLNRRKAPSDEAPPAEEEPKPEPQRRSQGPAPATPASAAQPIPIQPAAQPGPAQQDRRALDSLILRPAEGQPRRP